MKRTEPLPKEVIHEIGSHKVLLWDADSLVYFCLNSGKNEKGEKNPEYTEQDLPYLYEKLTEMIYRHINKIEEIYSIEKIYMFIKGKGNFRKELYPEYKKNRVDKPILSEYLYEYLKKEYNAISSDNCEAEDMVYTFSKVYKNSIIVYVDHDLEEIPGLFYNYKTQEFKEITEKESIYNYYKKLVLSEPGDNVKTTPGIGIAYFNKNFNIDFTVEQYEENLHKAYLKAWKKDEVKAIEQLNLAREILSLKNMKDYIT